MSKPDAKLANEMQRQLLAQYGPLLGGSALHQALGFASAAAMRQAAIRNQVGVRLFTIANRRGKFALTRDVADWLAACVPDAEQMQSAPPELEQIGRPESVSRCDAETLPATQPGEVQLS